MGIHLHFGHTARLLHKRSPPYLLFSHTDKLLGIILRAEDGADQLQSSAPVQTRNYGSATQPAGKYGITTLGREADALKIFINGADMSIGAEYPGVMAVGKFFHLDHSVYAKSDGDFEFRTDNGTPSNPDDDRTVKRSNNDFESGNLFVRVSYDFPNDVNTELSNDFLNKTTGVPGTRRAQTEETRLNTRRNISYLKLNKQQFAGTELNTDFKDFNHMGIDIVLGKNFCDGKWRSNYSFFGKTAGEDFTPDLADPNDNDNLLYIFIQKGDSVDNE